ncbi:MAG: copper resistance protein CopC [Rhodanobacter sp.]
MRLLIIAVLVLGLVASPHASAHAFPDSSSPHAGQVLSSSPGQVQVTFDSEIEPVFSTLIVKNAAGTAVSTGKGEVAPSNHVLLHTSLPKSLPPGKYVVYWSVVAHDGHHTEGHFPFTLQ